MLVGLVQQLYLVDLVFPAAQNAGAITLELNTSILLLPKVPMNRRLFDSRVGYFADNFTVYSDDQQK